MASEKILESKKAKVAALTEMLQDSVSFVLVDYKGISVEDDTKLRKELREAGVHYVVEKNSMLRFAFKNMGIDAFDEVLHGTTAVPRTIRLLRLAYWASSLQITKTSSI